MKEEQEGLFPAAKRSIANYINDEEGNISRNKLVTVGSAVILMGLIVLLDGCTYVSHISHTSGTSHRSSGSHRSHSSHSSHRSHSSSR